MCAEHRIRDTFDRLASEYDELKLQVIPGYRQVQDLALRYANANSSERVLELGCSPAEWASAFLRSHPTANWFLYADITVAADPSLERAFQEGWRAFMLGAGLDPERIPHVLADHRDNDLKRTTSKPT